jgi:hypothetical protein
MNTLRWITTGIVNALFNTIALLATQDRSVIGPLH